MYYWPNTPVSNSADTVFIYVGFVFVRILIYWIKGGMALFDLSLILKVKKTLIMEASQAYEKAMKRYPRTIFYGNI